MNVFHSGENRPDRSALKKPSPKIYLGMPRSYGCGQRGGPRLSHSSSVSLSLSRSLSRNMCIKRENKTTLQKLNDKREFKEKKEKKISVGLVRKRVKRKKNPTRDQKVS